MIIETFMILDAGMKTEVVFHMRDVKNVIAHDATKTTSRILFSGNLFFIYDIPYEIMKNKFIEYHNSIQGLSLN